MLAAMVRAKALGIALAIALAAAIITAAPAWADDSPPPADPAPTPRTAADVPPLVSEPLTASLGGPEPPPYDVTGPLDPSTQLIHVVVPHAPLDLPHDFVFPVLPGVGTATSRAAEASDVAPGTSSLSVAVLASAGSPSAAWAAVVSGGHSYQWNLWRIRGTVIDFSRGFAGRVHRDPQGATAGGGGL